MTIHIRLGIAMNLGLASCLLAIGCLTSCDSEFASGGYGVGGTVTGLVGTGLILQNNDADPLAVTSNGNFSFSHGVGAGEAFSVSVLSQPSNPTQTCVVRNGTGTVNRSAITGVTVSCASSPKFAFVANKLSNNISAYLIAGASGALAQVAGSPFASTGTDPETLVLGADGQFLYVINNGSNAVSVFSVNQETGTLSAVGVPVPAGSSPYGAVVNLQGSYLFVANYATNNVSVYNINGATGQLSEIVGSPFGVGIGPKGLAIDANGHFLLAANSLSASVSVLRIDPSTGSLSNVFGSPFAAGNGALAIAINTADQFAYVSNPADSTISEFSFDGTTGTLTPLPTSPLATGSNPQAVVTVGNFLYATNVTNANNVATYVISASGDLSIVDAATPAGTLPVSIAIDSLGDFVYVANDGTNNIASYTMNTSTGVLTPAAQFFVSAGNEPRSIVVR